MEEGIHGEVQQRRFHIDERTIVTYQKSRLPAVIEFSLAMSIRVSKASIGLAFVRPSLTLFRWSTKQKNNSIRPSSCPAATTRTDQSLTPEP